MRWRWWRVGRGFGFGRKLVERAQYLDFGELWRQALTRRGELVAAADEGAVANQSLSEILLLGRATALERAWVFIQLCRQQGLEAVMLAIPDAADPKKLTPRLVAVRIKNELYLFDPLLALPFPARMASRLPRWPRWLPTTACCGHSISIRSIPTR